MYIASIILQCLVATSLMTAFSYGLSILTQRQLREPELLNQILAPQHQKTRPTGWIIHYAIGLVFIIVYEITFAPRYSTFAAYTVAGIVSGIIGIAGWFITLNIIPRPPAIDRKLHYAQLLPAHAVFAIGAYATKLMLSVAR
jgi:hypothetical protein